MLGGAVARRYAQALYDIAQDNGTLDILEEELKAVNTLIEEEQGIKRILNHPQVTVASKKEVITQLFAGKVTETTLNFLYLIIDRHREAYLPGINVEYTRLANEARNRVDAIVTSAKDLTEDQKQQLAKVLSRLAGKDVSPEFAVDASLMGGLVVRIGDKVIDGSVKYRLETLKQRLMSKTS